MNFDKLVSDRAMQVDAVIKSYLPQEKGPAATVFKAMNYAVNAGGKRIRPMLMEETCQMLGGAREAVLWPFMAAIEMIHTYSLIHDDLPALDNDEYRRGQKTTHVVFGEAIGILAGDALLNFAFETAGKAFDAAEPEELPYVAKAMQILASRPGVYGMIGGQVVDVELTGKPLDEETLEFIYKNKTSALIQCAMGIGAVLAKAPGEAVECVGQAADAIGIAFQVQDDILDTTSTLEELGKPAGSDAKNEKTTYVTLKGIKKAEAHVQELSMKALSGMEMLDINNKNPFLKDLILWLIHREK